MAKATGLIFSLFDVASAREVPFGMPQYVQCILLGLTSVLLCVPFIFARCWFAIVHYQWLSIGFVMFFLPIKSVISTHLYYVKRKLDV